MLRPPNFPMRLRASPVKMWLVSLGSLVFVGAGALMVHDQPALGYVSMVFFGLCAIIGAINILPGSSYLEMTREGFIVSSLFRKSFTSWREIDVFLIFRVHHSDRVGWNYASVSSQQAMSRRLSAALAGVEAGLPDTYGMEASKLADLLNSTLQAHRNNEI